MRVVAAIIIVLLLFGIVDGVSHKGKAYPGVFVGAVDCSGKTAEQIEALVQERYESVLQESQVCVFVSEEAQPQVELTGETEEGNEDLISVEEARDQRLAFIADYEDLGASLDAAASAQNAVEYGRGLTGIFGRLRAGLLKVQLTPVVTFSSVYDDFVDEVNATVGSERVDYNIAIEDGQAYVTEGKDGNLVNDEDFRSRIVEGLLSESEELYSFVAKALPAPVRITQEAAELVCTQVNNAIGDGSSFVYESSGWNATPSMTGEWIATKIEKEGSGWKLIPYVQADKAKSTILSHIKQFSDGEAIQVSFSVSDGNVTVHTNSQGMIPLVDQAVVDLDAALFGSGSTKAQSEASEIDGSPVLINVQSTQVPEEMSFDEACNAGVISEITSFTTSYTYGTSKTETRNFNIHRAADLLNNSVCPAGGTWSFHDTAGECNEANGFQEAGVINEGIYSTSFGGGICQVATTVFNAVYDAGYYVNRRYSHTLYNSSYPEGRDAAVSWPDLDLIWSNDTESDVLLTTSYTEGTVSVSLWGVDPQREVSTYVSAPVEGEKYKTTYTVNESLAPKGSMIKVYGIDGHSIYVERTVYDKDGEQLSFQRFNSSYDPTNEQVEVGVDFEIPEEDEDEDKDKDGD